MMANQTDLTDIVHRLQVPPPPQPPISNPTQPTARPPARTHYVLIIYPGCSVALEMLKRSCLFAARRHALWLISKLCGQDLTGAAPKY